MNKKSIDTKGVIWDRRLLVFTKERLLIANAKDPEHHILDFIYVRDIVECELKEDESPEKLEEKQLEVIIRTADCGRNKGRSYIYRSEYQDTVDWEAAIDKAVGNAKAKVREEHLQALYGHSFFEMRRARMKIVYNSLAFQYMTNRVQFSRISVHVFFVCLFSAEKKEVECSTA